MHQPPGTTSQAEREKDLQPTVQNTAIGRPHAADHGEQPRHTTRRDLPNESPGRMVLDNQPSVYVTLSDISRGGCCVVRKGELALRPDDRVRIEIWREDIQTKISLSASVRWVRHQDGRTQAGLRFQDNSVRSHRLIDQYLQRSFIPGT